MIVINWAVHLHAPMRRIDKERKKSHRPFRKLPSLHCRGAPPTVRHKFSIPPKSPYRRSHHTVHIWSIRRKAKTHSPRISARP
ncbi:hypothetical protein TRAPUB_11202 [Trametes pubescens]|uniref:Uncharacterized protein n=1 Tax=Trametes pubescens TaxID=154538 RepID=A0A1M2VXF9_TRAPU|nr:hypothetical protein TRAPUB_11202 [Trametes pubescens]